MFSRSLLNRITPTLRPITLSFQPRTMSTNAQNISQAVIHDHREIEAYYDQYDIARSAGDTAAQGRWARQFSWEVARHSIGEELVVYPLFEKHLGPKGKEMADEDRSEHQTVKELLAKLERTSVDSAQHSSILAEVMKELRQHMESEESNDLPSLEQAISQEDSRSAATSFSRTKMFVPTRAHPSAPTKPPFETLAGLMAAPIDKLKDAFASFPSEQEKDAVKIN